jgi:hypothetical protein
MKLLMLATVVVLGSAWANAQMQIMPGSKTPPLGNDTLCFRYTFNKNDTLIYRVESADSVLLHGEKPLVKKRLERVRIVCDSVTSNGLYALSLIVTELTEQQYVMKDTTYRSVHPWLGRKVEILIDSLGTRMSATTSSEIISPSPGGVFAPILIAPLGGSCGRQNQSWISQDTLSLVENGFPAPAISIMNLWRVLDNVDTLGSSYSQIQYTQNGLGSAVVPVSSTRKPVLVRAVINAYGKYSFDKSRNVPYHLFATSELKIEYLVGEDTAQQGRHLIHTNYHLEELRSSTPKRSLP